MPDYLVIETTNGRKLSDGGKVVEGAKSAHEAVAVIVGDGYSYEQSFSVFDISVAEEIKIEQSRVIKVIDAKDPLVVIATYDEAAQEQLKDERKQAAADATSSAT